MIVIDASVWVSRLISRDVNHVVSLQWSRRLAAAERRFVVPTLFLAEVAGALARVSGRARFGHQAPANLLRNSALDVEAVDRALAETAAKHAADLPLKGTDALYVALAERMGIPLITWDSEQLSRAFRVIDVQTPTI